MAYYLICLVDWLRASGNTVFWYFFAFFIGIDWKWFFPWTAESRLPLKTNFFQEKSIKNYLKSFYVQRSDCTLIQFGNWLAFKPPYFVSEAKSKICLFLPSTYMMWLHYLRNRLKPCHVFSPSVSQLSNITLFGVSTARTYKPNSIFTPIKTGWFSYI